MVNAGVKGFKCFLVHSGVDEFPCVAENDVRLAMQQMQGTDAVFLVCAIYWCRDGAVVRALASHQCGPGSIPRLSVICGLSLLLVLVSALRVFPRVLWFSPLLKNQLFQIPIRSGNLRVTGLSDFPLKFIKSL